MLALGRQSLVYGLGPVVARFASLLLLPLYTHYLAKAQLGAVQNVVAFAAVAATVAQLGMVNALFRFALEREGDERWRVVRTALAFCAVSGLVAVLVGLALTPWASDRLVGGDTTLWLVGCAGLWVALVYEPTVGLYRIEQRARRYLAITVLNVAVTVAASVIALVVLHGGAVGLVAASYAGTAVALVVVCVDRRGEIFGAVDRHVVRPMLRFGLPFMPSRLAIWGIGLATGVLLTLRGSPELTGVYSVAYRLAQIVALLVTAFQLAWPPFAYSVRDDGEARRVYRAVLTYWMLVALWVVLGLALLRVELVHIFARRVPQAADPMALYALGLAFYGAYYVVGVAVGRVKKTQFNWVVTGLAAVVSIAGCLLLIPGHGVLGATFATTVAYALMAVLMTVRAQQVFPVGYEWQRIAHLLVASGLLFVAGDRTLPELGPGGVAARLVIALAFPLVLLATRFFDPSERLRLRLMLPARLRSAERPSH